MRNAGANNQQQQQQQNELGDSRQRFFLTISFSRFPSNCYWCVCALSSERISCICHFGVSSKSSKLYIQVRRIETRSPERFQGVFRVFLILFLGA